MAEPFERANIKIDKPQYSVFETLRKIDSARLILNPEFQRNFVWDAQRQSRLIESVLLRVPLPTFYFDATDQTHLQVVDGFQRLATLYAFCKRQTLRLEGLEFLTELHGRTFSELSDADQRIIEDTQLTVITVEPGTPSRVKFVIFERINTGGIALNAQEIRHALSDQPTRAYLALLAADPTFVALTTNELGDRTIDVRRMADRESVLRFLALKLNPEYTTGQAGLPLSYAELLNQTIGDLRDLHLLTREQLAAEFYDSMVKAQMIFEDLAFRKLPDLQRPGPFRAQLFDVWSLVLSQYPLDVLTRYRAEIVRYTATAFLDDAAFAGAITPTSDDWQSVATRFATVHSIIEGVQRYENPIRFPLQFHAEPVDEDEDRDDE